MTQVRTTWKEKTLSFVQTVADFAFPPVCVGCKKPDSLFCQRCLGDILWLKEAFCSSCGKSLIEGKCCTDKPVGMYSAVAYIGPIPKAIHHLKYKSHFALAKPLADMMNTAWQNEWHIPDVVVPIPLHARRYQERSYNQAALLAEAFAQKKELPYQGETLFRIRETTRQVGLNAFERKQNVIHAFWANEQVKNKSILLIDDVYTTGATMLAAIHALLDAGAKEVRGFTLAKATLLQSAKLT